jgi:hypothetical protein
LKDLDKTLYLFMSVRIFAPDAFMVFEPAAQQRKSSGPNVWFPQDIPASKKHRELNGERVNDLPLV